MVHQFLEEIIARLKAHKNKVIVITVALTLLDISFYAQIYRSVARAQDLMLYFLDVGQGDSELMVLPGGVKILIDGGPATRRAVEQLGNILPQTDRYIDIVMLSHPQLDHFGGLIEVLKRYRVGAFISNGRSGTTAAYDDLEKMIAQNTVPMTALKQGDAIRYGESRLDIIWPTDAALADKELNNTSMVTEFTGKNVKALFTGDIESITENALVRAGLSSVDVLKVPHHGSKTSTSENFLASLRPKVAAIEVGKNNYGHPTPMVLNRLEKYGVNAYRTDRNGTVKLLIDGKSIKVFASK